MKSTHTGWSDCAEIQEQMDAYASGELSVGVEDELRRHIENCRICGSELAGRQRLRSALKTAMEREPAPFHLRAQIQNSIGGQQQTRKPFPILRVSWVMSLAALAIIAVAVGLRFWPGSAAFPTRDEQDAYIKRISIEVPEVFRPGLSDHVHCAVFRKYPANPPSDRQSASDLGEFSGLLPQVREHVPAEYRLTMAHRCSYRGRDFVHLAFRKGSAPISLVMTRKQPGESFSPDALIPIMNASGVLIYKATADRFEIAGFDSGDFVAYVVSDLPHDVTLQMAAICAPAVRHFLARL